MPPFSINKTVRSVPKLPYEVIKNDILGTHYSLTLNFIGATRAQELNKTYRKKSYVPNVLAFPVDSGCGEVYITPHIAAKEASLFDRTPVGQILFLFIHALLHLKGYDHGSVMEKLERKYEKKYCIR